jgi:hypothetical protein
MMLGRSRIAIAAAVIGMSAGPTGLVGTPATYRDCKLLIVHSPQLSLDSRRHP